VGGLFNMDEFINVNEIRKRKEKGPYDFSMEENITMYDKMPYIRDVNICNRDTIGLFSGNIIKFYCYKIGDTAKI
jgi:hypothetical protein